MKKIKEKKDRILKMGRSPLADDLLKQWEDEAPEAIAIEGQLNDRKTSLSGKLEIGVDGHPVSILIIDEISGAEMEFSHVHNAVIMVEEKRKGSNGWISMVVGNLNKIKPVLEMLAEATLDELKKIVKK
jgi:hypothetical protein